MLLILSVWSIFFVGCSPLNDFGYCGTTIRGIQGILGFPLRLFKSHVRQFWFCGLCELDVEHILEEFDRSCLSEFSMPWYMMISIIMESQLPCWLWTGCLKTLLELFEWSRAWEKRDSWLVFMMISIIRKKKSRILMDLMVLEPWSSEKQRKHIDRTMNLPDMALAFSACLMNFPSSLSSAALLLFFLLRPLFLS